MFEGRTKSAGNVGKAHALQIFDKAKKSLHDTRCSLFFPAVDEKEKGFINRSLHNICLFVTLGWTQ
jgi:hypothetical protein